MTSSKHLLMIPITAYGHMIPLFELANRLVTLGNFKFTFVVSVHLLKQIKRKNVLKTNSTGNITLYPLQHDVIKSDETQGPDGPNNVGNLVVCFNQAIQQFLRSAYSQENNRFELPEHGPVDAVICDNFMASFVDICYEKKLPIYHFVTASARALLLKQLLHDMDSPVVDDLGFVNCAQPEVTFQPLPPIEKAFFTGIKNHSKDAIGIIVNSVQDIEESTLAKIRQVDGMQEKGILFVGPLIPDDHADNATDHRTSLLFKWLDKQPDDSVVYVSFGTVASLKPEQMEELAKALVSSGHPFIWSLSDVLLQQSWDSSMLKAGICSPDSVDPNAPFLVLNWVPQRDLLKQNRKLAAFVTHCGWNSTLETLSNGVRMICWPMFGDQGMNAEFVESLGIGFYIKGTGMQPKRLVEAEEISSIIKKVTEDKAIAQRACEYSIVVRNAASKGSSCTALEELKKVLH